MTVSDSTLSSNSASAGGGIYNAGGTVTVSDSNLSGNDANFGGGIDNAYGGTVTVSSSTLSGNYATRDYSGRGGEGGGIYNSGGMVTISSSILSSNSSTRRRHLQRSRWHGDGQKLQQYHRELRQRWGRGVLRRRVQPRRAVPG